MSAATIQLPAGAQCRDIDNRRVKMPVDMQATVLKELDDGTRVVRTALGQVLVVAQAKAATKPKAKPRRRRSRKRLDARTVLVWGSVAYTLASAAAFGWIAFHWVGAHLGAG